MSKAKKLIKFVEEDIHEYYSAEYYIQVGEHGGVGNFSSFEQALKKAREIEIDKETWYTGVSGDGPKFAIVYVTQEYLDLMSKRDAFADEETKEIWMTAAKKSLQTGEEVIGRW